MCTADSRQRSFECVNDWIEHDSALLWTYTTSWDINPDPKPDSLLEPSPFGDALH